MNILQIGTFWILCFVISCKNTPTVVVIERSEVEQAYFTAYSMHSTWREQDLASDYNALGVQYDEFRDKISEIYDGYQEVIRYQDEFWGTCALYQQSRVYFDAAQFLYGLQETPLFDLLSIADPSYIAVIENFIRLYLDSSLQHLIYAENALAFTEDYSLCANQIRQESICAQENVQNEINARLACTPEENPFDFESISLSRQR